MYIFCYRSQMRYITISSQLRVPRAVPVSLSPTNLARIEIYWGLQAAHTFHRPICNFLYSSYMDRPPGADSPMDITKPLPHLLLGAQELHNADRFPWLLLLFCMPTFLDYYGPNITLHFCRCAKKTLMSRMGPHSPLHCAGWRPLAHQSKKKLQARKR